MTSVNALYKLEQILDNPKYEGFGMGEQPSLRGKRNRYEDLHADFDSKIGEWVVPRLSEIWKPLRVLGRVRPYNDFPSMGFAYPVFSARAVTVLRDVLERNGELLPLVTSVGDYFYYNCTTVADIIDRDRSILKYLNRHTILNIDHLQVRENCLAELSIFQMKWYPGNCFVTDCVVRRIREAKLEGFEFRKIWPLPEDVPYYSHRKRAECHDELTLQPATEVRPIKGNAVLLRLALEENEPSVVERSRFEEIADELDAMLVNPRKNAKYYGSLEVTEFAPREVRLFFSCPDADELARKLKPWVVALDWDGEKALVKRYGEFVDAEATEEIVKL